MGSKGAAVVKSSCSTSVARFDSRTQRHMWGEFDDGCHPCSEGFLRVLKFSLPPKTPALQILILSLHVLHCIALLGAGEGVVNDTVS